MAKTAAEPYVPKYDLTLKEGQTFKLNIKVTIKTICAEALLPIFTQAKKSDHDDDDGKPKAAAAPAASGTTGCVHARSRVR